MSMSLTVNIVPFSYPESTKDFYFTTKKQEGFYPLKNYKLPANAREILELEDLEKEIPLYTNFLENVESDLKLSVSLKDSPEFALHYYRVLLFNYFKSRESIVRFNFINDIEIWLEAKDFKDEDTTYYHKIGVRVQIGRVTDGPELLLYYCGKSRKLNESIAGLENEISTVNYKKVLYKDRVYNYKTGLPDYVMEDMEQVYPLVNRDLIDNLELDNGFKKVDNRFEHIQKYLKGFYQKHIASNEFKEVIPVIGDDFMKVPDELVSHTSPESNLLKFSQGTDLVPKTAIWRKKPLQKQPHNNLHFIFIRHKDSNEAFEKTLSYFNGNEDFYGIRSFVKVPFYHDEENSIIFSNKDNPIPEIKDKLRTFTGINNVKFIAIYLSPFTKEEKSKERKEIYYKIKELLLEADITSQVIEEETVFESDFKWSMTNIGLAILAKLGGKPWKLKTDFKRELIFGVGAFHNQEHGVNYIGNTFCFNNEGLFKEFACHAEDELFLLAGQIEMSILEFQQKHRDFRLERLIIHFYKVLSEKELKPIIKVLERLKIRVPVFVVTINKTESEDFLIFDRSQNDLMPYSGTIVNIGRNEYLLCNNSKYKEQDKVKPDGYHLPVKLKLSCSKPELLTDEVATELIDQVYQFSRMYWKALKQQNLPVTIKYPEMVAQIAPHFKDGVIPPYGRNNLWFL